MKFPIPHIFTIVKSLSHFSERSWDYYLSFAGNQTRDFASVPVVLDFEGFTASWWMRGPIAQSWSAVFSLVNVARGKILEFLFMGGKHCRIILDGDVR